MDFSTIGPILIGALGALGFIGQYLRKQARTDRIENRKLRKIVVAYDSHCYKLERGWSRMGRRPPRRPPILLEAEPDEDVEDAADPDAAEADERSTGAGPEAGRRRRHGTPD